MDFKTKYNNCKNCHLHKERTNIVFGEGNLNASIMIIGEGPGRDEDLLGRPFIGRSGRVLDSILEEANIDRKKIYISNIVKCRPPGNRNPTKEEINSCSQILEEQISVIKPKIVVTLGLVPLKALVDPKAKITQIRGKCIKKSGIMFMPTYHPAYILRNPKIKIDAILDFKQIKQLVG